MLGATSPNAAEWTAAVATAVGGIGAALGALFAWLAARAARDTAHVRISGCLR